MRILAIFTLVALSAIQTAALNANVSASNESFSDFVDLTVEIRLDDEDRSSFGIVPAMVAQIAKTAPIGEEGENVVCFLFSKGGGSIINTTKMIVGKNTNLADITDVLRSAFGPVRSDLASNQRCSDSDKRHGAHQPSILVARLANQGWNFTKTLQQKMKEAVKFIRSVNATAVIVVSTFNLVDRYNYTFQAEMLEEDRQGKALRTKIAVDVREHEKGLIAMAELMWYRVKTVVSSCNYRVEKPICRYGEQNCGRNASFTFLNVTYEHFSKFCGSSGTRWVQCKESKCESLCEERLDEAPCQSECGPGHKNLTVGEDELTMYCKVKVRPCTNAPCTEAPSSVPLMSTQARLGVALMVTGAIFFFGPAIIISAFAVFTRLSAMKNKNSQEQPKIGRHEQPKVVKAAKKKTAV